ncbi:MAG: 5-formyltetrahydrofolate cyclo-ligase [candidate division KSB1 bacterium]|nr:5-formyltetrahydrofolate cyclo-ligase [candidate division KSB1 bacterium]
MLTKVELRRRLLQRRALLTPVDVARRSVAIAAYACALPAFCVRQTIMVYLALPQEVQTLSIIACARRLHKRIAVPAVRGDSLVALELPDDPAHLRCGRFGILEPDGGEQDAIPPEEIGYILVPGVAFDYRGGRLGFGKGYYDRFLRQLPTTTYRCGLAFAMQVVPRVPQAPHDIRVHGIATEQGFIPCVRALPARGETWGIGRI